MKYVTIPKNDFERVYHRQRPVSKNDDIEGMRLSLLKDELILNIAPGESVDKNKAALLEINIKNKNERLLIDKNIGNNRNDQYGDRFHVLHGYYDDKEYVKNFFVSRLSESGSLLVYDANFKHQYAFGEDETVAYIDSASSKNAVAFISRKKAIEEVLENEIDELTFINQSNIENEQYHNICQTHKASEMIAVGISDSKIYLLEILHGSENGCIKDIFYIYTIDQKTGAKIGRADIVMRTGEYLEPEGNGLFHVATEYFPGNLEQGYGIMRYNEHSLYKPHGYHDLGVEKTFKIMTSCNNLMPCSQYIESGEFRKDIEPDEILIHIVGVDWISDNKVAFTYTTYDEREDWTQDNDAYFDDEGLEYHIDIIDLSSGPSASAYDSLNFRQLELDMKIKCHTTHEWVVSMPYSCNGKRLTLTDKYIAVPVLLSPISLYEVRHKKSVVALFDRYTLQYVSYIELGKDIHKDSSKSINSLIAKAECDDSEPEKDHVKIDVMIVDITSDCSQIAVSYIVSQTDHLPVDKKSAQYTPPEPKDEVIYIEVFKDNTEEKECYYTRPSICDRAKSRDWKVGI